MEESRDVIKVPQRPMEATGMTKIIYMAIPTNYSVSNCTNLN